MQTLKSIVKTRINRFAVTTHMANVLKIESLSELMKHHFIVQSITPMYLIGNQINMYMYSNLVNGEKKTS